MSDANAAPVDPLRVILIGRTGLEPTLRLDEKIELVRVPTPIHAIGEASGVSEPTASEQSVIIFSSEARDKLVGDDRTRFLSALARTAPHAKTAALGDREATDQFDVAIASDCSGAELRLLFKIADVQTEDPDPGTSDAQVEALLDSVLDPLTQSQQLAGDEALVAQMLSGHDVTAPAVELLRRRVGDGGLRYVPGSAEREGTPIIWRGSRLGTLIAENAPAATLSDGAAWLAAWLALERQMTQLREEAFTDPLTGAWNRRFFDRYIVGALSRALKDRRSLTLLMFDIDDFKRFNDQFGHATGDLILCETVRLLTSVTRPTDKVCRMGGDEFVVIFDDPKGPRDPASEHPDSVFDIAHRFQQQIAEQRFPALGLEAPGNLAISGGLATFPWDGRTAKDLLENADRRTLQSKRMGKNVITIGPGGG